MEVFFSLLNGDEQATVTRHLSAQPRSRNWDKKLPDSVATTVHNGITPLLAHSQSPLVNSLERAFPRVHINGLRKHENIRMSARTATRHRLLERVGCGIREVVISDLPRESHISVPSTLYTELTHYCQGLRVLRLRVDAKSAPDVPVQDVMKALKSSLEVLSLSFRHGAGPIELEIPEENKMEKLRELNLNVPNLERLVKLFELHKDTLDTVYLRSSSTDWKAVIDTLQTHCRNLKNVSIVGDDVPHREYADLLKSYGTQLQRAKLRRVNVGLCAEIIEACPNMRCDFLLHNNSIDKFSAMAPSIRRLDLLRGITHEWKLEQFRAVAHKCDNITVANLRISRNWAANGRELVAFFDSPKLNLRELHLDLNRKRDIVSDDLAAKIAASAAELRTLTIASVGFVPDVALAAVLNAAPKLKYFTIRLTEGMTRANALAYCTGLLGVLRNRAKIKEIEIELQPYDMPYYLFHNQNQQNQQVSQRDFEAAIREAIQCYRLTTVHVQICGKTYFV